MKAYAEYKPSGVEWLGEVPSHWTIAPLKSVITFWRNGKWGNDPHNNSPDNIICLRVADFNRATGFIDDKKLTLRNFSDDKIDDCLLEIGDILIERSGGGEKQLVGDTALFDLPIKAVCSNFISLLKINKNLILPQFLKFQFDNMYYQKVNRLCIKQTSGIQNLDLKVYLQNNITYPPLAEQQKIAQFLDTKTAQIDALITEQNRLIELLTEQRKAVISHAVTKGLNPNAPMKKSGVEWLGEVPNHWQAVKSKNIFGQSSQRALKNDEQLTASQKYGVIPQRLFMEYENQKVVLALTGLDNFKHIDKNDFVISLRSFQGGIELCHYDGCVSPAYTVLKAKSEINNNYFAYLLKDVVYIQALNTAVIGIREGKNISYNNFGEIFIPFPPLAEQNEIVNYLDQQTAQIDALISEQKRLIERLKEYRTALISAAVTGKIDVQAA